MKVSEITLQTDIKESIKFLIGSTPELDIETFKKQYNTSGHDTLDLTKRPDKIVETDSGPTTTKKNRLAFPFQKRIVNSSVSYTFGNPVHLKANPQTDGQASVLNAVNRIFFDNKINSQNRKVAREIARCTEVAEIWFSVEVPEKHDNYGFPADAKIRTLILSPWDGNKLYPYYDKTGNMTAFSRNYFIKTGDQNVEYFEVYTDSETIRWEKGSGDWVVSEKYPEKNLINKIPVIYGRQEQTDWQEVQSCIDRLEYLLSNYADMIDYHASPTIIAKGQITGFAQKGEQGKILQIEDGAEVAYLTWAGSSDAVKLEIETLIRFIYTFTQTPDVSFESVKGLNQISGIALQMLFLDAHLKVMEKREIFDEYLQRRVNIVKAFVGQLNTGLQKEADLLEIEPVINPFTINDLKTMIENLQTATGGQAILSQKTAIAQSGLVDDADAELELILGENAERAKQETFAPAV